MHTTPQIAGALAMLVGSAVCAGDVHAADTAGQGLTHADLIGCWERVDRYLDLVQGGLTLCMQEAKVGVYSFGVERTWERDGVKLEKPIEALDGYSSEGTYTLHDHIITLRTNLWFEGNACEVSKTTISLIFTGCKFRGEYFLKCRDVDEQLYCKD